MPAPTEAFGEPSRSGVPAMLTAPPIRQIKAGQHVHRRGLAGAVLADQAQHATGRDLEAHLVVGEQRAEALGQAFDPDGPGLSRLRDDRRTRRVVVTGIARDHRFGILPTTPSTSQPMPLMSAIESVWPAATTSAPVLSWSGPVQ